MLAAVPCNKCGERRELVLAGCVCATCSRVLDNLWGNSAASDWVLIGTHEAPAWALSVYERISTPERLEEWLSTLFLHLFRNTSYAEMKTCWAKWVRGSSGQSQGPASPDEIALLRRLCPAWAVGRDIPFIRPATLAELSEDDRRRRNEQRYQISQETLAKWGFDDEGCPLERFDDHGQVLNVPEDQAMYHRLAQADAEIEQRLQERGLAYSDEERRALRQEAEEIQRLSDRSKRG